MSSILTKDALNDFISPSQVCINPIKTEPKKKKEIDDVVEVGKEDDAPTKVNITLQDCLACSGCVTTSEELLLEQHSYDSFLQKYRETLEKDDQLTLLVSISPTCRISLMNYLKFSSLEEADAWFVGSCATLFQTKNQQKKLYVTSTEVGKQISTEKMLDYAFSSVNEEVRNTDKKPLLTAVCPGVVLYIEKQHNNLTSQFIKVKPEMSALGQLIKKTTMQNEAVYHLAIMPCFDKKLESSKIESTDVDCVLTPRELVNMFIDNAVDLTHQTEEASAADFSRVTNPYRCAELADLAWSIGADEIETANTSGGYAFKYIQEAQTRMRLERGIEADIVEEEGKNSDVFFYKLVLGEEILASSCKLYGFKNLQNLVRKLDSSKPQAIKRPLFKSRKSPVASQKAASEPSSCDFIELLACPGGCINGGGLLLPASAAGNSRRKLESLNLINSIYLTEFKKKRRLDQKKSFNIPQIGRALDLVYIIAENVAQEEQSSAALAFTSW